MGLNTLTTRNAGDTILDTFFNDFNTALGGDFVGRNTAGVPTSGQNLGTNAIPWGTIRTNSLVVDGQTVDPASITVPPNRVISGKVRATSNQPAFITPNGAALSLVIAGGTTNLVLDINGTSVTVSTDITKSALTAAPSSNNTALVNDTEAADQHDTRLWGENEHRKVITIDTIGSAISALNGKFAAFKIDNGADTEYFLALVDTTNNRLLKCQRGYFYDPSENPINPIVFSDGDTITLMKLGFIFVENNGTTVDVTYNVPHFGSESPSSPVTGDYWYDLTNNLWKRYDGASFQIINRTLVGLFVNDTTACVAARCVDFYAKYQAKNTIAVEIFSDEIVRGSKQGQVVNVAGNEFHFDKTLLNWNITTDFASAADMYDATEQSSRLYYLYVKDTGEAILSDIPPYFRYDLEGRYHRHNPWRCVGIMYNNASGDIDHAGSFTSDDELLSLDTLNGQGAVNTSVFRFTNIAENNQASAIYTDSANDGASFLVTEPCMIAFVSEALASAGQPTHGFTKNAAAPVTTDVANATFAEKIAWTGTDGNGRSGNAAATRQFKIGDIIRPQGSAGGSYNAAFSAVRLVVVRGANSLR